jgi:hypothetical protein
VRLISYLGGDEVRAIAVLDVDRDRVLLSQHRPGDEQEIERIASLPFSRFQTFINGHSLRRCQL